MDASSRSKRSLPNDRVSRSASPQEQHAPALQRVTSDLIQRAQADPSSLTPADVQVLQRTVGNRAIAATLAARSSAPPIKRQPIVQAKLVVGPSGDPFEQEANSVARQVVGQLHAGKSISSLASSSLKSGATPRPKRPNPPTVSSVQRRLGAPVERGASAQGGELSPALASHIQRARGGGEPLAAPVRTAMEQAFGADFAGVRIHQSAQADTLNRSISARAFTSGQDLFFRQGEYNPGSVAGQGLLAHELTHVVQQSGGQLQRADGDGKRASSGSLSGSLDERLPSAQQVAASGQYLGQPPQISQQAPQGRIHRCDEDVDTSSDLKSTSGPTSTFEHPAMTGRDTTTAISTINSSGLSEEYKARAIELLNKPDLASQAGYGICGITSMLRAILLNHPDKFAELTIKALADDEVVNKWRPYFQTNMKKGQEKKELDYLVAQWLVRKGATGEVSQKILKRTTKGVTETDKKKQYSEVYKKQEKFGDTFKMGDREGQGHFATTAGGTNYMYSQLTGKPGFKIEVTDFAKDYAIAKQKAGPKGTISASIRGHEFYKAKGEPVDNGPKEKHPAKYRHWVMLDDVQEQTRKGFFGSPYKYFKLKVWTYEGHYDALVWEDVIGQYINYLVVM